VLSKLVPALIAVRRGILAQVAAALCVTDASTWADDPSRPNAQANGVTLQAATPVNDSNEQVARRLRSAYPDHISDFNKVELIWRDGTRMPIDDGAGIKDIGNWLASPDIKDIFRFSYPVRAPTTQPPSGEDPGRARPAALFNKMYGDCRRGEVARHLVDVVWLPSRGKQTVKATAINGVAQKLAAVSAELDALPDAFTAFLVPSAGGYNCRAIAGTEQASAHSYGIAIDIAVKHAHYWRWSKPAASGRPQWRNAIPDEVVRIFEKHGFIWGGRWHHFDTMHFEYRPELLIP
jgi:hypothetical protein